MADLKDDAFYSWDSAHICDQSFHSLTTIDHFIMSGLVMRSLLTPLLDTRGLELRPP